MYKYLQRDRVSFKEEIWFTLKRYSMSANAVRNWCTDLWNSFIIWQLRPKCSPFLVYLPVILAVMTNRETEQNQRQIPILETMAKKINIAKHIISKICDNNLSIINPLATKT